MRYDELLEVTDEYEMEQAIAAARKIRQDCEHYLRSKSVGSNLVRGDNYTEQKYTVWDQDFTQFRNRDRIYSSTHVSQIVHDYLDSNGFKATRLRGKFCYKTKNSTPTLATNWFGKAFVCFPVGNDWDIMYIDEKESKKIGFKGGDYGGDYLVGKASDIMDREADDDISYDHSLEEIMKWFLDRHGNIFKHSKSANDVPNQHECVLYAPNVHMLNANLLVHNPNLLKILYKGIS